MNIPKLADNKHCTGCMACADACPKKAIECVVNDEGHYTYNVDSSKCVLCHQCEAICPIASKVRYGTNDLIKSFPYAAWSIDEKMRANATSGGVFPEIAKTIISKGGVVFGATQDGLYPKHIFIDKEEDIIRLQGSKYTQSRTEGVFLQVRNVLNDGRYVLFSGLGCQVSALLSFLKGNKNLEKLYTIDLICGGVPSLLLIQRYVAENDSINTILSYRTKTKYEMTVVDKTGSKHIIPNVDRPLPLTGFTTGATERYICYDCPFSKGHRLSDITIGDYWGNTLFPEEIKDGVSVAVVHSEKGKSILATSRLRVYPIEWRDFLFKNPRMVYGKGLIPKSRKIIARAFSSYSYERIQQVYGNKGTIRRPWTIINKAFRVFLGLIYSRIRVMRVKQILKDNRI